MKKLTGVVVVVMLTLVLLVSAFADEVLEGKLKYGNCFTFRFSFQKQPLSG